MKEFQSTTGGRHAYNSDFKNLQELALAMQEIFRECGSNFVISGCNVAGGTVSDGYVYIGNRVCKVKAADNLQTTNLYIVAKQKNGDSIPYADGGADIQYIDYYAEATNNNPGGASHIAYNATTKSFPNLATAFFNNYAVCKGLGNQIIDSLTVQTELTVPGQLYAPKGLRITSDTTISKIGNDVCITNGNCTLCFSKTGAITVKQGNTVLFSFSDASGTGRVTFNSVSVQTDLRTKKLYLDGVDVESKFVPLGTVQMWAGPDNKIPANYKLCNGDAISCTDYAELYAVLGDTFNLSAKAGSGFWPTPGKGLFRLPDLRQRFIVGYSPAHGTYGYIGAVGGQEKHYLSIDEMPSHSHTFDDYYYIENAGALPNNKVYGHKKHIGGQYMGTAHTDFNNDYLLYVNHEGDKAGNGQAHENRPPFYVLAYIMRVK